MGLGAVAAVTAPWDAMAGPFAPEDFEKLVPKDKKLSPAWVNSLFERGAPTVYKGADLRFIGMPIGGICAGQVYLGGDGKLWRWDIFNQHIDTGSSGPHYAKPLLPESPFEQGFALRVVRSRVETMRPLGRIGWRDISFNGEYPIAHVEYRDPEVPVTVSLEAFSPFIPLNAEDSSLPATVMRYTVKNPTRETLEVGVGAWLENATCLYSSEFALGTRENRVVKRNGFQFLQCSAVPTAAPPRTSKRDDIFFDDFEREQYAPWTASGTAFGNGPVSQDNVPEYQGQLNIHGTRAVNTHAAPPASTVEARDAAIGTLTSKPFVLERDFISFLIGGGGHKKRTCLNLLVDGKPVRSATGKNNNRMEPHTFDVRRWAGKEARLQVVDEEKGPWGNIGVEHIVFTDEPGVPVTALQEQADFGTMGLALLREGEKQKSADLVCAFVPGSNLPSETFSPAAGESGTIASKAFGEKLIGCLSRSVMLKPGKQATFTFIVTWHFPNLKLGGLGDHRGRQYGKRFQSALAVADYIAENFDRLQAETRLWHDTWYNSTLPYWFLDRTFLNTSILATSTAFWLGNGRFYGWEGAGCCAGTCGHVWHYAHAVARLFPTLERNLREMVDYGAGFDSATGRIRFRAEHNDHWAVDGQAGVILRTLREFQMSSDDAFLRRVWPRTRKALEFLIEQDSGKDGIIDGPQHNTLDTDWWGEIAWLSGLYVAALRAGSKLAIELGDKDFARKCDAIADKGKALLVERLFDGEFFINKVDAGHLDAINSGVGCHIDQVFGQSWAFQIGLDRVLPEDETRSALRSLWRYNFTPDVGPYRAALKPGRWYAMPGEAGLLMCTFPRSGWDYAKASGKGPDWAAGYFNECMNGFEYQAAGHMVWENMVLEGFAITRAVHDRYHPSRRNPWNEIECGDHYARSMASYGVFLAACGFEYNGPHGRMAFAPRLTPHDFRAAFTAAEGWGSFSLKMTPKGTNARIDLKWGRLKLNTLAIAMPAGKVPAKMKVKAGGKSLAAELLPRDGKALVTLSGGLAL